MTFVFYKIPKSEISYAHCGILCDLLYESLLQGNLETIGSSIDVTNLWEDRKFLRITRITNDLTVH